MFIGHYGMGLALKGRAPKLSLGLLILGSQFPDILFPLLSLLGLESSRLVAESGTMNPYEMHYPWSHSLLTVMIWSILYALLITLCKRGRISTKEQLILGGSVLSHYLLDLITHNNLPLIPGLPFTIGLGLGHSVYLEVALELAILAAGTLIYLKSRAPRKIRANIALIIYVLLMTALYSSSIFGTFTEPSTGLTIGVMTMQIILISAGFLIDWLGKVKENKLILA